MSQPKEPTFFERAIKAIRTLAFNRGVQRLTESGDYNWQGPPMWRVDAPNEIVRFFEKDVAERWAIHHNCPINNIQESSAHFCKPEVLRWYAKQRALGMDVGSDAQHIISASKESVDDMIAWFNSIERFDTLAAYHLLKLGFSAGRPDVTNHIAKWAEAGPWFWFNWSHMSGSTGDPFAMRVGDEDKMCLFARCLSSVALTEWLFEHQPQLKDILLKPEKWSELQKGLAQADLNVQSKWPWIAHHIFGLTVSPLNYATCQETLLTLLSLHDSFGHDPAAQCYLSYNMMKKAPWVHPVPQGCTNLHAAAFHEKVMAIRNDMDPATIPTTPLVDQLMIAVYLDQPPSEFYTHAQNVFNLAGPTHCPTEEAIDNNVFT